MKFRPHPRGFALVGALAIIVIVTILLVAFATTMRTERTASQNFMERDRAEAIGMGLLNRILAEHAVPDGLNGAPVEPFAVNPETGLPTDATATNYFAATGNDATGAGPDIPIDFDRVALLPIYQMVPDNDEVFKTTGLLRTSKSLGGEGSPAYSREFWAYDGLTSRILGSTDAQPASIPEWVDYYQPNDPTTQVDEAAHPVAEVAFAIWDEGGKFDVNVIGADESVNGLAPHDLKVEEAVTGDLGGSLRAYLDGQNGQRDRNNFSLRKIESPLTTPGTENDKGDDRWIFSIRELILRNLIDPAKFRMVTTWSRDFDVRPEWDGDRRPLKIRQQRDAGAELGAEDFLRSYINNPALFRLFYGAGRGGPYLVSNNLNNEKLRERLDDDESSLTPAPSSSIEAQANWMQVMRLLAVLRRGLSPYDKNAAGVQGILSSPGAPGPPLLVVNQWDPFDVWGIGQNIIQASSTASDYNLIAYNPKLPNTSNPDRPYNDPNARVGVRLSPLITEVAVKVRKFTQAGQTRYEITNYIKLWNPYPFQLQHNGADILYRVGLHTGHAWPGTNMHGLWAMGSASNPTRQARAEGITAPDPGRFKVIRFQRILEESEITAALAAGRNLFRVRPYLQDMDYSARLSQHFKVSGGDETPYSSIAMPGLYALDATNRDQLIVNMENLPKMATGVQWFSFQIDDPRMASIKRNTFIAGGTPPGTIPETGWPAETDQRQKWSWILYPQHALQGCDIYVDYGDGRERLLSGGDPHTSENYNGRSFVVNGEPVSGYNRNFGINWPGSGNAPVTNQDTFEKMMATFALPGRPLLNIGEIGTVFAMRPWVTLNFANKIVPEAAGIYSPPVSDPSTNKALLRPAAILDYFTTMGTPELMNFDNPNHEMLRYLPAPFTGYRPSAESATFLNQDKRYQDRAWLFESLDPLESTPEKQVPDGNLRPIRGRINLNTASVEVLTTLLKAPYRMPASLGLQGLDYELVDSDNPASDYLVTIDEADARAMAQAITRPITDAAAIRPLRMLSDLSQLYDHNEPLMRSLYEKYPQSVISAMIGRLAQFGTVRQQIYTIDMVVRMLNPAAEARGERVVVSEARLQARVYFDTFSRQAFIESVEYK